MKQKSAQTVKSVETYLATLQKQKSSMKPAKTRGEVLKRLDSLFSLSAKTAIVKPTLSLKYAKIDTAELIIYMCKYINYRLWNETEQIVRRNWQKYQKDPEYRKSIDLKQSMAKHCVLLRSYDLKNDIIIMNSHKGDMSLRLYIGSFGEQSNLYNIQIENVYAFIAVKHVWNEVPEMYTSIKTILESITLSRKDVLLTQKQSSGILVNLFAQAKSKKIRFNQSQVEFLIDKMNHKQEDISLSTLQTICLKTLINFDHNSHVHNTIGYLDSKVQRSLFICDFLRNYITQK